MGYFYFVYNHASSAYAATVRFCVFDVYNISSIFFILIFKELLKNTLHVNTRCIFWALDSVSLPLANQHKTFPQPPSLLVSEKKIFLICAYKYWSKISSCEPSRNFYKASPMFCVKGSSNCSKHAVVWRHNALINRFMFCVIEFTFVVEIGIIKFRKPISI